MHRIDVFVLPLILSLLLNCCGDDGNGSGEGDTEGEAGRDTAATDTNCETDGVCESTCPDDPDCVSNAGDSGTGNQGEQGGSGGSQDLQECSPACGSDQFCNHVSGICVSLEPEWIAITGGTFQMGSEEVRDADPVHSVTVPDFEIMKTEVTTWQYAKCFRAGVCASTHSEDLDKNWGGDGPKPGRENHPINSVNWFMATDYCQWIGARLPTESEWEYAAKSSGQDIMYPWRGDKATCDYAVMREGENYDEWVDGEKGCGTGTTMEVCSKPAGNTEQGLCDMLGNVEEWIEDDWHGSYDWDSVDGILNKPTDGSAWVNDPDDRSSMGVLRGGNFGSFGFVSDISTMCRGGPGKINPAEMNGFRCAR